MTSGGITGTPSALPTATPTDWQIVDGYLIGPFSDLTDAALAGANLTDSNLRSTNLTDADMSGSNLTDSSIRYTNLEDTNLTDAILTDVTSLGIQGTPQALPPGWELVNGVLEMTTIPPLSRRSATRISSAAASTARLAAGPSAAAAPRTQSPSAASSSPPAVTTPQRGIDVYAPDVCQTSAAWQQNAVNEMRGIKSLGANSVSIAFPFYTTSPTGNSVFGADLCNDPESPLPPLQSPSPARLAVLVRAAESVGLQVMIRPLMEQSNLYVLGDWRGDIDPTSPTAWFTSYEGFLKPYLEMAQANNVALFSISSELSSLSLEKAWAPTIAFVHSLYTGELVFDSSWNYDSGEVHQGTAVALDAYPPLAQPNTATVAQLLAGWNDYLKVQPLPTTATHVTFDEVGIAAADGAYADPNIPPANATFNQTIQANWFTAACEFVKQHKLEGMYFWGQQLSLNLGNLITRPNPQQVSELQPAAQAAIRKCFA